MWDQLPPIPRELRNSKSSNDNHKFVTKAVAEMLEACAVLVLPSGILPIVVSPLGVVPKPRSDKLSLVVNMKCVNEHLAKRVFKFEGLSDLSDMSKVIGVFLMTLRQAIIMCRSTHTHANMSVLNGRGFITNIIVFPLGCPLSLGYFQKSSVNLSCIGGPRGSTSSLIWMIFSSLSMVVKHVVS